MKRTAGAAALLSPVLAGLVAAIWLLWGVDAEAQTLPGDADDRTFTSLSLAEHHTCGVTTSGKIRCWGNTRSGPILADDATYTQVAANNIFTCGLRSDHTVQC